MDENPAVGVSGCWLVNPDGSLQLACRRSTLAAVAFYRHGTDRLFPSKVMARYLTYLATLAGRMRSMLSGLLLIRR
jgi:hypothetical protein